GVVTGALGRRRQAADRRGSDEVRRARTGEGARRARQADRSRRRGRQCRRRGRPRGGVEDMIRLDGKVAIVTGASRGIGRAIATMVAAQRGDNAAATVAEIAAAGGKAETAPVDVADAAALEALVAGTLERHGRVDILVNNAGITRDQLMLRMKRDDWDAVIATNLTAAFGLTQAVLKPMIRQ